MIIQHKDIASAKHVPRLLSFIHTGNTKSFGGELVSMAQPQVRLREKTA